MNTAYDIEIFAPSGAHLTNAPITPGCEIYEELMGENYVQLDWNSNNDTIFPAGSYMVFMTVKYTLLEEYIPDQTSENSWHYTPRFQHPIMLWSKIPFFMYTTTGGTSTKEIDWVLTAGLSTFLDRVQVALQNETGINWTVSGSSSESKTITFSGVDILSAINMICDAFGVEWCARWGTKNLYFATHIQRDSAANLITGVNIGPQRVVSSNKEYYNRFYVFGSTRNIAKDYRGAGVSNIANKRLTLNPATHPEGYLQRTGTSNASAMSKILIFDDIYPAATNLTIKDTKVAFMYTVDSSQINNEHKGRIVIGSQPVMVDVVDEDGNPVIDPETGKPVQEPLVDDEGNPVMQPIYDSYPIWFFSLKAGAEDYSFNKDLIISGLPLSVHFLSGSLTGREFELVYHDTESTIKGANTDIPITIPAGYFEIVFKKEGDLVIPSFQTLNPGIGNQVVLFNITMPGEYLNDAYDRLESAARAEIERYYSANQNQYEADSYPTEFAKADFGLYPGRRVLFNGISTRVLALTTRVDSMLEAHRGYDDVKFLTDDSEPFKTTDGYLLVKDIQSYTQGRPLQQKIKVGDTVIKGAIKQLQDEAFNANQNIDVQAILQDTTKNLADAFNRSYSILLHNLDSQGNMWIVQPDKSVKLNPEYIGVWAEGFGSFGGKAGDGEGGDTPGGGGTSFEHIYTWSDLSGGMTQPTDDNKSVFNAAAVWNVYNLVTSNATEVDSLRYSVQSMQSDLNGFRTDVNGLIQAVGAIQDTVDEIDWFTPVTINGQLTLKLNTRYVGVWAEGFGSFGGASSTPGGGGGAQFSHVYNWRDLGDTTIPNDGDGVFDAYATNYFYGLFSQLESDVDAVAATVNTINGDYVTLSTTQEISGEKTFTNSYTYMNNLLATSLYLRQSASDSVLWKFGVGKYNNEPYFQIQDQLDTSEFFYFDDASFQGRGTAKNLGASSVPWNILYANSIRIGNAIIVYDTQYHMLRVYGTDGNDTVGLYTDGPLSGGGVPS